MRHDIVWTDDGIRRVLRLLKSSGYFDLPVSKGYDLRKKRLGFGQRMNVIKLYKEARYLFDEAKPKKQGDQNRLVIAKGLAMYSSNVKAEMAAARKMAGLKSHAWKAIPFPVIPTAKRVVFEWGPKRKTFITRYPDLDISHTLYVFDHEKILKGIDYDDEETSPVDQLTEAYREATKGELGHLEDKQTFFRMSTVYGDVSSTDYHPATQNLDSLLEDQIGKANEKYVMYDSEGRMVLSGILRGVSAWTNEKGPVYDKLKTMGTNFNRPAMDKRGYEVVKPRVEWWLVKGKQFIPYETKKHALWDLKLMEKPEQWHLEKKYIR